MDLAGYKLRTKCIKCGNGKGYVEERNGQKVVFCGGCDSYQYNAPKTETGESRRSVKTTHAAISPKQRSRILERANRACEICHATNRILHVGHVVSVLDGHAQGLTDAVINSDENLIATCEECNLGTGRQTLPMRLLIGILMARKEAK